MYPFAAIRVLGSPFSIPSLLPCESPPSAWPTWLLSHDLIAPADVRATIVELLDELKVAWYAHTLKDVAHAEIANQAGTRDAPASAGAVDFGARLAPGFLAAVACTALHACFDFA